MQRGCGREAVRRNRKWFDWTTSKSLTEKRGSTPRGPIMPNPCEQGHPPLKPMRGLLYGKYQNYWRCDQCHRNFTREQVGRRAKIKKPDK